METASLIITAIATVAIAWFSWCSYQITRKLMVHDEARTQKDEEFRQQLSDLYQGIIIATLLSGPSSYGAYEDSAKVFKNKYKGQTPIPI